VLFGTVFLGLGLGMWRGPRLLHGLSRRRLFGVSLTMAGVLLFPLALVQQLVITTLLTLVLGFFSGVAWVTGNTLLGLEVPNDLRGRTFAFVNSLIRLSLALVLAAAPLIAGFIGTHTFGPTTASGRGLLTYNGAAFTFLIAACVMTAVGVTSYRQMDDRKGTSLMSDLRNAFTSPVGQYAATGVFVAFEGGEGAGRELPGRDLERVARWATDDLRAHLTVLLDLPPQAGLTRFAERDRIEAESLEFHERVRRAFLQLSSAEPEHYLVVDARLPVGEIEAAVRQRVGPLLPQATRHAAEPPPTLVDETREDEARGSMEA
jgi:hypothetical protein